MSDQPTPETPERDSWRTVALGFNELHTNGRLSSLSDVEDRIVDLTARVAALLAVEDKHPPVFHIRPVWVRKSDPTEVHDEPFAGFVELYDEQYRWGAREANGEVVIPESEPLTHRDHAIRMAHRFADPLGARVLDDEGNEV